MKRGGAVICKCDRHQYVTTLGFSEYHTTFKTISAYKISAVCKSSEVGCLSVSFEEAMWLQRQVARSEICWQALDAAPENPSQLARVVVSEIGQVPGTHTIIRWLTHTPGLLAATIKLLRRILAALPCQCQWQLWSHCEDNLSISSVVE